MTTRRNEAPPPRTEGTTKETVQRAALRLFARQGFHGTSIRQIAEAAGLSVPGVYHHYASKDEILESLCDTAMEVLGRATREVLEDPSLSVLERFDGVVDVMVRFHAEHAETAFVSFSEIRSLRTEARRRHVDARRRQQEMIDAAVHAGIEEGIFACPDPRETGRALSALLLGISQWYAPDGARTPAEISEVYRGICRRAVGLLAGARTESSSEKPHAPGAVSSSSTL